MSVAALLYLVLGFSVGLSVAAAVGAKVLLRSSNESADKTKGSEQHESRGHTHNGDVETPAAPTRPGINMESFMDNTSARSPAPEDVRDQIDFAAQRWPQMVRWMFSEEWRTAAEESRTFEHIQKLQERLNLSVPPIDYTQFLRRSMPEDIEDLFRDSGRLSRSA